MSDKTQEIVLEKGKYTFRYNQDTAELTILRHGEPSRSLTGDKAVWFLFNHLLYVQESRTHHSAVALVVHETTVKENEHLRKVVDTYQSLLNKVNLVTSNWRHRRQVDDASMNALCNRQIAVEDALRKLEDEK